MISTTVTGTIAHAISRSVSQAIPRAFTGTGQPISGTIAVTIAVALVFVVFRTACQCGQQLERIARVLKVDLGQRGAVDGGAAWSHRCGAVVTSLADRMEGG